MKKRTGLYPAVEVDSASCGVVSQAGGVALLETARVSGLDRALRTALDPWRAPRAVHDPAKVLLDLAVALALGGDCLADIAVLRAEPGVYGPVASDPTVSRTIDALAADAPRALGAINAARAAARARVWELGGQHAPNHRVDAEQPLVVDVDATLVTSHSDKEQARPTFKRGFGHHPLWAFADHGQNGTGEPLAVLLRPGNAGSNTAADHITVLREAAPAPWPPGRPAAGPQGARAHRRGWRHPRLAGLARRATAVVLRRLRPARQHRETPGPAAQGRVAARLRQRWQRS